MYVSVLLHEFIHFVILDVDMSVTGEAGFIRLEVEVSEYKALASALAGPLAPFSIGLALWHYVDWGLALPFLLHILALPLDVLGALGTSRELC